jgi:hypothetical protein
MTAVSTRASNVGPTFTGNVIVPTPAVGNNTTTAASTAFVQAALVLKASTLSPTFTGVVTVPTATAGDATTAVASTAYVQTALVAKASTLSPTFTGTVTVPTLAVGNASTGAASAAFVQAALVLKAGTVSPTFTGTVTVPTPSVGNATTAAASAAFVQAALVFKAPTFAPTFTGNVIIPTAAAGNNTTTAASTAFVTAAVAANFTGQHKCYSINNTIREVGFIASATGEYRNQDQTLNPFKSSINESLPIVQYSNKENEITVFGVISDRYDSIGSKVRSGEPLEDAPLIINSIGEGGMWVSNINGNILNGEYIASSMLPGLGMRQDEDSLRSYTVSKITTDCNFDATEMIPRRELRYVSVTKTRELITPTEVVAFSHLEDMYVDEEYSETICRQIIDVVSKTINDEIIDYNEDGIPTVRRIERQVDEEVPMTTTVLSYDSDGNETSSTHPVMETVTITNTRTIPVMIDVALTDGDGNDILDACGNQVIQQYQRKEKIYTNELINISSSVEYQELERVVDPSNQEYIYDIVNDLSGNVLYDSKYVMKYIVIYSDKYSIYLDELYSELYTEIFHDFTNVLDDYGSSVIGNTYKMAFVGCTYHCG